MSAFASSDSHLDLPPFTADVAEGLSASEKRISPRYLYDEIGVSLFHIITRLPEYGIASAQERLRRRYSAELGRLLGPTYVVSELADVSHRATSPIYCCWLKTAAQVLSDRRPNHPVLLQLLGSSAGNLDRAELHTFLQHLRELLQPGDHFLLAADLVKPIDKMVSAYDDPAGIVAAFHRNLLARINRELAGRFDPRSFRHSVRWNAFLRRVELHLVALKDHEVYIGALGRRFGFRAGESIRTESAYKFSELEIDTIAGTSGFRPVKTWVDIEWAFAETLWTV